DAAAGGPRSPACRAAQLDRLARRHGRRGARGPRRDVAVGLRMGHCRGDPDRTRGRRRRERCLRGCAGVQQARSARLWATCQRANPGKFLSTVQIGITGIAVITGYFSGATLGEPISDRLAAMGVPARYAGESGVALVMLVTTFLSLMIGELVPKQIALRSPL